MKQIIQEDKADVKYQLRLKSEESHPPLERMKSMTEAQDQSLNKLSGDIREQLTTMKKQHANI
jgi:hypothetical protein